MKREFLQNLKVGQENLPKEVIDAIMAENGRDIEAAKKAAPEGPEVEALRQQVAGWEEKFRQQDAQHQQQLAQIKFEGVFQAEVQKAGGRNAKAIGALLDLQQLQESEDPQTAVEQALKALKEESGYLFHQTTPPPYARGTGTQGSAKQEAPVSLAGALREKFERK